MMEGDSRSSTARVRAGGFVLSLIADPLTVPILRAHLDGPLRLPDLRERIGGAKQTTLRGQVDNLRAIGALERHVLRAMPYTVENRLTDVGRDVLAVADLVETWLNRAPQGPIALGSEPAKEAIRALIGGWSSTMLRALVARPLSLIELNGVITDISYPALERRLSAMRTVRQVEIVPGGERGAKPHRVTDWTRRAVGILVAAARCDREHFPEKTDPLTGLDIETAFLLAVPLVELEATRTGSCLLAVDTGKGDSDDSKGRLAGVHVDIEDGAASSCASRLEQDPSTWALGSVDSWVDAILEGRHDRLHLGGENPGLVKDLVQRLQSSLAAA